MFYWKAHLGNWCVQENVLIEENNDLKPSVQPVDSNANFIIVCEFI